MRIRRIVLAASLLAAPLSAQDARARLESRGLPADLVTQVAQIAADATAQGLPPDPIVDKAIEGFAKHIPAPRITSALQQFMTRMADGRTAVQQAGVGTPGGELVAAAAEALGRGIAPAQVGTVVHAAREVSVAAPGLTVVAALAAQGMAAEQAVAVVTTAMRNGQNAAQILDLPSLARSMQGRGMSPDEAGRRMVRGGDGGGPPDGGDGPRGPGGPGGGGRGPGGPDGRPGGPPPPRPPGHGGPGSGDGGGSGRPPRP